MTSSLESVSKYRAVLSSPPCLPRFPPRPLRSNISSDRSSFHNLIVSTALLVAYDNIIMAPKKVWVKLRDSRSEVFKVEVDERADFDDLKKAIKQRKTVRVASIFTEDYEEGSKCEPADLISSHGSVGRADTPFYFTIAPPGMYFSAFDIIFLFFLILVRLCPCTFPLPPHPEPGKIYPHTYQLTGN